MPFLSCFSLTASQQKPINNGGGEVIVDLNLGSPFAAKLGLAEIDEWDDSHTATTVSESSVDETSERVQISDGGGEPTGGGKKKKNKKKKKK